MKTIKTIAFMFLIVTFSCDTDKNVAPVFETFFTKYYGADGNQSAVDLLVNPDGTMIMLGNTNSQISQTPRPYLVKIDNMGNVLWQRQLGQLDEQARDIDSDGNGGLLIVSNTNVLQDEISQIRVYNLDQNGKGIDSVSIDNTKAVIGKTERVAITQTGLSVSRVQDGSVLVVGTAGPDYIVPDLNLTGGADQADLLVFRFKAGIHTNVQPETLITQAGEHVGQIVKGFQSTLPGSKEYIFFGDSDRPFDADGQYRRTFEILVTDEFGNRKGPRPSTGILPGEAQIASTAIITPGLSQDAYLVVGTLSSTVTSTSKMLVLQYLVNSFQPNGVVVRIKQQYDFGNPRVEGTTAAVSSTGQMYILGNIIQDNNKRDVVLVKVDGDGNNESHRTFGALEGDDVAAAVGVLPDGRIAVVATIELETQKKIALFMLSPDGAFVND